MKLKLLSLLIFPILLLSCTSVGPIDKPNFNKYLLDNSNLHKEPIVLFGRVQWFKGEDGYDFLRLFPNENLNEGVLVLQNSKLSVLKWEDNKYKSILEVNFSDIKDVRRRVWGASQRTVIETKDGKTEAFTLVTFNGQIVSIPQTARLLRIIENKIQKNNHSELR